MEKLGVLVTEITEDRVNLDSETDSDADDNPDGFSVGTGTYSVRMRLHSDLPQFVPICGKRIRLYYKGITKQCTNCFGPHIRKNCNSPRVQWIEYVSNFMSNHDHIPSDYYGKWAKIVEEWRTANDPTYVQSHQTPDVTVQVASSKQPQAGTPDTESGHRVDAANLLSAQGSHNGSNTPIENANSTTQSTTITTEPLQPGLGAMINLKQPSFPDKVSTLLAPIRIDETQMMLRAIRTTATSSSQAKPFAEKSWPPIPPFDLGKQISKGKVNTMGRRKASI
jgi:hypothetical protein